MSEKKENCSMEVSDTIARAAMRPELTNCMLSRAVIMSGLEEGRFEICGWSPLIVTESLPGYKRLYYFLTPDRTSDIITISTDVPVYADITRKGDIQYEGSMFEMLGMSPYRTYIRLGMCNSGVRHESRYVPVPAVPENIGEIQELLRCMFDPMADALPADDELAKMINNGTVLKITLGEQTAGVLLYEDTGVKSYLRALAVNEKFRGKSVGLSLMSYYLEIHPVGSTKLFYLWTDEKNTSALALYRKLGYAPDGLKNHIFRKCGCESS